MSFGEKCTEYCCARACYHLLDDGHIHFACIFGPLICGNLILALPKSSFCAALPLFLHHTCMASGHFHDGFCFYMDILIPFGCLMAFLERELRSLDPNIAQILCKVRTG